MQLRNLFKCATIKISRRSINKPQRNPTYQTKGIHTSILKMNEDYCNQNGWQLLFCTMCEKRGWHYYIKNNPDWMKNWDWYIELAFSEYFVRGSSANTIWQDACEYILENNL
jgi:hypothetical protein